MAKYKPYNYSQTVMLPVSLKDQLADGTLEFDWKGRSKRGEGGGLKV